MAVQGPFPFLAQLASRQQTVDKRRAYLAAIEANERSLQIQKKIDSDPKDPEALAGLRDLASKFEAALRRQGVLAAYSASMDGTAQEIAEAETARKAGRSVELRNAMMRALANINTIVVDLLERGPEADR